MIIKCVDLPVSQL